MGTATILFLTAFPGAKAWVGRLLDGGVLAAVVGRILVVLVILLGARLLVRLAENFGERLFRRLPPERALRLDERRAKTLSTLIASITRYVIYFFAGVMILQHLGFNTASLLTAAGIGGLAIGFGAQNLVRDVITGFFILFEDQYGVGDYVTAGGVSGVVEEMGIRITKIRDFGGELHIVPNGQISQVTNHMGPAMQVLIDVAVSPDTDLDQAIGVLEAVLADYARDNHRLVGAPAVLGVQTLSDAGVTLRVMARTKPMEQWGVERELKRLIKQRFDAEGIRLPFPYRLLGVQGNVPVDPAAAGLPGPAGGEGKA